jgi:hypothetical protein
MYTKASTFREDIVKEIMNEDTITKKRLEMKECLNCENILQVNYNCEF